MNASSGRRQDSAQEETRAVSSTHPVSRSKKGTNILTGSTEKWWKGSVASLKESVQSCCVSKDSYPRKSTLRKEGKLGSKHTVKFSKGTWHQKTIWKERVHREESFISVNLMSAVRAHPSLRRGHKRKLRNKRDAPAEQHGTWREHIHKFWRKDKATFFSPVEIEAMPAPMPKSREERIFVVFSCCRSKLQNECRLGKGKFCDKVHRHRSIRAAAPR